MSTSGQKNKTPLLFISLIASLQLLLGIHASNSHNNNIIITSSCATTLYPDLCYSTLSTSLDRDLTTTKDVIELAINKTKQTLQSNFHTLNKISARTNLTKRGKIALHDCLQMVAVTLQDLNTVIQDLKAYPNKKTLRQHADDLKTLMSASITNKESCLDGFSHDATCKQLRKSIIGGQDHAGKMCSNVLAMVKNLTDTDMANQNQEVQPQAQAQRRLKENDIDVAITWPEWLSAGDRRLLQSAGVTPNVTVAADGSGDYTTVSAAVTAAPSRSQSRYVIKIAAGVYRENVEIPSAKTNLMFIGDGRTTTIITASLSVAGGSTTFNSATVAAVGGGFLARDITFQNTAGPSGDQAVALRVGSDLSAFYRCSMLAYQDTLYVHSNRQFYVNCVVVGTVDFIFGNAAAVLQNCDIKPRRPGPNQKNMVTAQGRTDPNQNTGIVIQKCTITANSDLLPVQGSFPSYLGRPWKEYSRTVVMQSSISDVINPAGWYPWDGDFALDTLYYREYQNTGAGADTSKRVTWKGWGVITDVAEATSFTPGSFIAGGSWLPSTGFPFTLGL